MTPQILESFTPIVLALCGALLGIAATFAPSLDSSTRASAIGLASAAIGAAGGLAKTRDQQPPQ